MLSAKKMMFIENLCLSVVLHDFAMMINPKNRGCKFEWANFPDWIERWCELHLPVSWALKGAPGKAEIGYAKKTGRRLSNEILKESGLLKEELEIKEEKIT
jgi:hypothetical protein